MLSARCLGIATFNGHTFLPGLLGPTPIVVDLGAHAGEVARRCHAEYGSRSFAVEAAPELASKLQHVPGVSGFHFAIAGREGQIELQLSSNPEASTIKTVTVGVSRGAASVPCTTLESFLSSNELRAVDLLKVDIEGAEVEMFDSTSDETLRRIGQIAVEFHDFCDLIRPADVERVSERLRGLGFWRVCWNVDEKLHHDVLFVNAPRVGLGALRRAWFGSVV